MAILIKKLLRIFLIVNSLFVPMIVSMENDQYRENSQDEVRAFLIPAAIGGACSMVGYLSRFRPTRKVSVPLEAAGNCVLAYIIPHMIVEMQKLAEHDTELKPQQRKAISNIVSIATAAKPFLIGHAAGLFAPEAAELFTELDWLDKKYFEFLLKHRDLVSFCIGGIACVLDKRSRSRHQKNWSNLFGLISDE